MSGCSGELAGKEYPDIDRPEIPVNFFVGLSIRMERAASQLMEPFGHEYVFVLGERVLEQSMNKNNIFARQLLKLADVSDGDFSCMQDELQLKFPNALACITAARLSFRRNFGSLRVEDIKESGNLPDDILGAACRIQANVGIEESCISFKFIENKREFGSINH